MEKLNSNQKIIISNLVKENCSMSELARRIIVQNVNGITSKSVAERIVRLEVENIRLKHNLEIDGLKYYLCGTNIGYSLEKQNSPILLKFLKRQLKRNETSNKILNSLFLFNK